MSGWKDGSPDYWGGWAVIAGAVFVAVRIFLYREPWTVVIGVWGLVMFFMAVAFGQDA